MQIVRTQTFVPIPPTTHVKNTILALHKLDLFYDSASQLVTLYHQDCRQ